MIMISKLGQVMVYVNNQEKAVRFWTETMGFAVISEENNGHGMRWFEIAPKQGSETRIILHDKEMVSKMSPELHLGTPSLMFFTSDIEKLHSDLTNKNVKVGEIITLPTGKVFNFADDEDNYFAVSEKVDN